MYFVFYFIAGLVLFVIFLSKFLEIIFDKTFDNKANKLYAILLFFVMLATIINIIIAIIAYRKTINMAGQRGNRGIAGDKGKRGKIGQCKDTCGQQVCYLNVIEKANKTFQDKVEALLLTSDNVQTKLSKNEFVIKNEFFLDKINSICKSEQYQSLLLGNHPKKPNENKLIEYLEGIIEEWVEHLLDTDNTGSQNSDIIEVENKGVQFLLEPFYPETELNYVYGSITRNPFSELKKYDIWNWGDGLKINPLQVEIQIQDLEKPRPDQAQLQIKKTNNYDWKFGTNTALDKWSTAQCEYGQMGPPDNPTNPQNLTKCVSVNPRSQLKEYVSTWKTDVYGKDTEMSLYTPVAYKDAKNNQQFYPVGSVWRGIEDRTKPANAQLSPASQNSCGSGHGENGDEKATNIGPEKNTILVSGNVKKPESMELIWDSNAGCSECQVNDVKVYRPIPKEGYVCLGDVAATSTETEDQLKDKIRCVPEECVVEKSLGNKFYDNKTVYYDKYDSYKNYIAKTPYESNSQLSASFWAAGVDNLGAAEEQKNLYGLEFEVNDGYNLFRMGRGLKKPNEKAYVINEKCLLAGGGKNAKDPEIPFPDELVFNDHYKADDYFGVKPSFAILTNDKVFDNTSQNLLNFEYKPLRIYLEDDLIPRKSGEPDTFFLKTYNEKKNEFSKYIVVDSIGNVKVTSKPSNQNNKHKWIIEIIVSGSSSGSSGTSFKAKIKSKATNKYLFHYYDNMGRSKFILKDYPTSLTTNWIYNTPYDAPSPQ